MIWKRKGTWRGAGEHQRALCPLEETRKRERDDSCKESCPIGIMTALKCCKVHVHLQSCLKSPHDHCHFQEVES